MPKRTNDFQKLVYAVRQNLAEGAKVTESKLLRDRITGTRREVDVCIESTVGGLPVTVSIECRDHKRVADVTWVEAMKTKHDRLPTNALFLASKSGFTQEARNVADALGIRTFTLEDVEGTDFQSLMGSESTLWIKSFRVSAHQVKVTVPATGSLPQEVISVAPNTLVHTADGSEAGEISALVEGLLRHQAFVEQFGRDATQEHVWFELQWNNPSLDNPIYLKKLEPEVLREIEAVRIAGPCKVQLASVGMRRGKLGDVSIAWGTANAVDHDAILVATKDTTGQERVSITFTGKPTKDAQGSKSE